jgi:nucleosome assembly protein 1-like 1
MAEPIPNKRPDVAAPTPQNTPANNAPISSHAQQPGVASIKEGDESGVQNTAALLAQNPHLANLIHGKLNGLVGRSSGYIESLPPVVRRRISGLKGIQQEHSKLEVQLQEEVLELEKKYFSKFEPLYNKRAAIVNGGLEPTEEEVQAGETNDDEDEGEEAAATSDKPVTDPSEPVSGIPEFWLSAMKNQLSLAQIITDRDEAALKHLTDIRLEYLEKLGFKLIFEFAPNDFFTNKTITKTYMYSEGNGYGGEFIYDHAEGDKIDWKEGKNLTVIVEQKKQRNKNTKQTRIIKKTVATESFFNFFSPPKPPVSEDEEEVDEDIEDRLELDYQLGEDIKEKLIPHAIDWFTGEAMRFEEIDEDDLDDVEFDDDDDDDENMSEDHDDDESDDDDDGAKPKSDAAECKQS